MAWRPNKIADQAERDVEDYLRALGWFVLPVANYTKNGAPILKGGSSALVQPDQIAMRKGETRAFECKWKQRAIPRCKFGCPLFRNSDHKKGGPGCSGRPYTGIDYDCYYRYRKYEGESGHDVTLVFLHDKENEVRCATLWDLDRNAHDSRIDCTQEEFPDSKGGMRNYWYDEIPRWVSYDEMRRLVAGFRSSGRAEQPSTAPVLRTAPTHVVPVQVPQHPQQSLFSNLGSMTADRNDMHSGEGRRRRR